MGYALSPRLRAGLVSLSLVTNVTPQVPVWMVERSGSATQAVSRARTFVLPDDAPRFGGSTSVDSTMFLSPSMEIGIESCRERVCQYVSITVVPATLKTKQNKLITKPP